jgi:hypothetical protein
VSDTKYGQGLAWTDITGRHHEITVSGCDTWEEAAREVIRLAEKDGWTPPRWWQFWRWNDTRPDKWGR